MSKSKKIPFNSDNCVDFSKEAPLVGDLSISVDFTKGGWVERIFRTDHVLTNEEYRVLTERAEQSAQNQERNEENEE